MTEPCTMEEERDPRFRRLSTIGAIVNFLVLVVALIATVSNHWANLSGPIIGYMGPFIVCQDIPGGFDRCEKGGLGPYRQTWAAYVAGAGSVLCTVFLTTGSIVAFLVVSMHQVQHAICLKFRHATFLRVVVSAGAAMSSLVAVVCFILEAKVFTKMQTSASGDLSWSFYLEIVAFFGSCVVGTIASVEWQWARKLGGDPTVYARDPEGTKSETIVNPNFRDGPRKGIPPKPKGAPNKHRSPSGANRSGKIHRTPNGIAMTHVSGLPYTVTVNNGSVQRGRPQNGHRTNGTAPQNVIAFDPNRTPLRSSLRRAKKEGPSAEDTVDLATTEGVVQNPSFANTSPTQKKKVRIHTQSTAV